MTGTYHELSPVYRQQYPNCSAMEGMSFESEEGLQSEPTFPQYTLTEADNRPPEYSSPPQLLSDQQEFAPISNSQYSVPMPNAYQDNQLHVNDLSSVGNRQDLQWITTSTTDIGTHSPLNMSPRLTPPVYLSELSPPDRYKHQQDSIEDGLSSVATISHSQLGNSFSSPNTNRISPVIVPNRTKKANNPNAPTKPKGTPGRKRKFQDHELTPAEAARRHIRRERNKVAAAKCRNRRRELTDRLQGETGHLEDHQNMLQHEIMSLQQEKDHLEHILASHSPNCKAGELVGGSPMLLREESRGLRDERMLLAQPETIRDYNTCSDANLYFRQPQPISSNVVGINLPAVHSDVHCNNFNGAQGTNANMATNISSQCQVPSTCPSMTETRFTMTLDDLNTLGNTPLNIPISPFSTQSQNNGAYAFPNPQSHQNLSTGTCFNINKSTGFNYPASQTVNSPHVASMQASFNRMGNPLRSCSAALRRRSSSESHQSPDSVKSPKLLSL